MVNMDARNYDMNGSAMSIAAALLLTFTWISVILRSYTRSVIMHCFQLDDWFMLTSQIIFTLSCSFTLAGVRAGMGQHNYNITDQRQRTTALMCQALATATYVIDMMFIKLSIGVFLLRLSVQPVYKYIIWACLIIVTVWSFVVFLWDMFQCRPVAKQWDSSISYGTCAAPEQVVHAAYAISVMTILSDWLYALLPIPMLWKVKMTTQAKTTVILILSLGIFASIATLVRLRYLTDLNNDSDILYAGTDAMVWTIIEPGVAIIASSLATIRPLLRALRVHGFESTDRDGTPRSSQKFSQATPAKMVSPANGSRLPVHRLPRPIFGLEDVYLKDLEDFVAQECSLEGVQRVCSQPGEIQSTLGGRRKPSDQEARMKPNVLVVERQVAVRVPSTQLSTARESSREIRRAEINGNQEDIALDRGLPNGHTSVSFPERRAHYER